MDHMVATMPGYISHASFRDDTSGRGVTISYFESMKDLVAWKQVPEHSRPKRWVERRSIASTRLKWPRLFATTNGRWSNCSVVCSTPCAIWTPRTTSDEPVAYDNMTPASHQPSRFVQFAHQPGAHGTGLVSKHIRAAIEVEKSQRNARRGELSCF